MAVKTALEEVVPTQDGPFECYDAVVTAREIATLYKTGFLKVDPDHQRGVDAVTKKPILDMEKIERWADQLIKGEAYLGQLSWNFRKGETSIQYDPQARSLAIGAGAATIPDSYHRHRAILKAVESAERGSGFDLDRRFSVKIYHVPVTEENRIFYAMNQEGKKADPTRSKWLHRVGVAKLAGAFVENSEHLRENVDTVRDRLSKRNPRLCAFNTLSGAFEEYWSDVDPQDEAALRGDVEYLTGFWKKLVSVRPELAKLNISRRKKVRETSLVDSGLAIIAYVALARKMREEGVGLEVLNKLAQQVTVGDKTVDHFSRENPLWKQAGVLVPVTKKNGTEALNLRNARQSRQAMLQALAELIGVSLGAPSSTGKAMKGVQNAGVSQKDLKHRRTSNMLRPRLRRWELPKYS
jgi:hypothetical protein